ncbi:MAG: ABC transporter ATP-binding protein [Lachnospiraceae bacterium]|nr:ABC transporter ATP-binding protein [Lachnospiraceae bacterium]
MKTILQYMKAHWGRYTTNVLLKTLSTLTELTIPYILEHIIDHVVPTGNLKLVFAWGLCMIIAVIMVRTISVGANYRGVAVARDTIRTLRHDMFQKTINLSGNQFDSFGLPSLTSRMTSDSYNVQKFLESIQSIGIRAPIQLMGGIIITMIMDPVLSSILCVMVPVLGIIIFLVTRHGIPLYDKVQQSLDQVMRIMRENITGIRVVKALSKEEYEKNRFDTSNEEMAKRGLKAGMTMATPGPIMQMSLNIGLVLVVIVGAHRVNSGAAEPGVILAFLTYFNMILHGVMGINRVFIMSSKAAASGYRIGLILQAPDDQPVLSYSDEDKLDTDAHITFDHVSFGYHTLSADTASGNFAGEKQEKCLNDINFSIRHGESLGIIGATGSGKTTIINLLMRFYDCDEGNVYIDGRDVRTYDKKELRSKFGIALQNDIIFADTLYENISFGRDLTLEQVEKASENANLSDYINGLDDRFDHMAEIKGANLSGGQKQRTYIARALAAHPSILILDDSSSALDYKTDAQLRKTIQTEYADTTTIMIAQRVSSIMNLTNILVLEDGQAIGYGSHEHLLETCPTYYDIYQSQMGDLN